LEFLISEVRMPAVYFLIETVCKGQLVIYCSLRFDIKPINVSIGKCYSSNNNFNEIKLQRKWNVFNIIINHDSKMTKHGLQNTTQKAKD